MTAATEIERLLRQLSPDEAAVAVHSVDPTLVSRLTVAERGLVASARAGRQAEFATGRACAHRALAVLGADVDTIARGGRREPSWPDGVTGSISHAAGMAAAVALRTTPTVGSVGLDLERDDAVGRDLWPQVLTATEQARCDEADVPNHFATAMFGAKEAAFKAVYPLVEVEIDFLDARVDLERNAVEVTGMDLAIAVRQGRTGSLVVSVATVAVTG